MRPRLLGVIFVLTGVCVPAAHPSAPPTQILKVTPTSIGGATLARPASFLSTQPPDEKHTVSSTGITTSWWIAKGGTDWAVQQRNKTGGTISLGYWGPLRTAKGDRTGTPLVAFRENWPRATISRSKPVTRSGEGGWNAVVVTKDDVGDATYAMFMFDSGAELRGVWIFAGESWDPGRARYCYPVCQPGSD